MNALEQATATVFNNIYSYITSTAYFDGGAQMHEPKSAPGVGLTCAMYVNQLTPVAAASGLDATSFRLEIIARIYKPFLSEPADMIDINVTMASASLMGALTGDFDLGGSVRNVDLLGAHGQALGGRAGYITIGGQGSGVTYRTMDITIPVILNDVFDQGA